MMKLARVALLLTLASSAVWAQTNVGEQEAEATLPFQVTPTATFGLPWRIAFLPDGRMLVTEKIGPIWLVSAQGEKIAPLGNTPPVYWQNQNGMLGVYVSPHFATDESIYITYIEPGDYGGGQALARAKLDFRRNRLLEFTVLWRVPNKSKYESSSGRINCSHSSTAARKASGAIC